MLICPYSPVWPCHATYLSHLSYLFTIKHTKVHSELQLTFIFYFLLPSERMSPILTLIRLCQLGKGGFGRVYKAKYNLDDAEYAIKKIVICSAQLQKLLKNGQLKNLLKEVTTLARLNHCHVARYYHCWVETRPANESDS